MYARKGYRSSRHCVTLHFLLIFRWEASSMCVYLIIALNSNSFNAVEECSYSVPSYRMDSQVHWPKRGHCFLSLWHHISPFQSSHWKMCKVKISIIFWYDHLLQFNEVLSHLHFASVYPLLAIVCFLLFVGVWPCFPHGAIRVGDWPVMIPASSVYQNHQPFKHPHCCNVTCCWAWLRSACTPHIRNESW